MAAESSPSGATDQERRRRREAVFGEVLPESTTDDRDASPESGSTSDDWLRRQVPPHHGS
ncbi:MAG: hypothetical protein QM655_01665 [Nocardioidaceae bacterium]